MQTPLTFFFAFVAVLVLIGVVAWLVRRFAGNRLGGSAGRGRMPRLAVIDAAAVDGRRRLVLVRRDNVEHLLMIGGPSDIVVEQNIVRAAPARDQVAPRGDVARLNPFPDEDSAPAMEPVEPSLPEPPTRPARPSFADELRRPAAPPPPPPQLPPLPERRHDPLATISSEPVTRPEPRPDLRAPRNEPMIPRPPQRPVDSPSAVKAPPVRPTEPVVTAPPPPPPPDLATADQNLAEMAKRLEAALRRPSGEARPAAAEPQIGAPPVVPEAPSVRPAPRVTVEPAPGGSTTSAPEVTPPSRAKGDFENLEDEMASLLGRPKTPS
ncbi:MAG: flagellar biosynthetic protein FliO [Rhizobiales bacterium]|nr:flagellar biosynthetic protein FliO [Hyphomicrobiales bacterium]